MSGKEVSLFEKTWGTFFFSSRKFRLRIIIESVIKKAETLPKWASNCRVFKGGSWLWASTCIECRFLWRRKDAKVLRNELRRSSRENLEETFFHSTIMFLRVTETQFGAAFERSRVEKCQHKVQIATESRNLWNYFENSVTSASLTPHCLHKSLM